jgi:hypothetical protein
MVDEQSNGPAANPMESPPPPRPVRGPTWVILPPLIGAAVGAALGAAYAHLWGLSFVEPPKSPIAIGAEYGAAIGGAVGLAYGMAVWVCFPYKRPAPSACSPEIGQGVGESPPTQSDQP